MKASFWEMCPRITNVIWWLKTLRPNKLSGQVESRRSGKITLETELLAHSTMQNDKPSISFCVNRKEGQRSLVHSSFSQTHKISNIGIVANVAFRHIYSFFLYLHRFKRIIFQGCKLDWFGSVAIAQLKRLWKYWHSCIVECLWKALLP